MSSTTFLITNPQQTIFSYPSSSNTSDMSTKPASLALPSTNNLSNSFSRKYNPKPPTYQLSSTNTFSTTATKKKKGSTSSSRNSNYQSTGQFFIPKPPSSQKPSAPKKLQQSTNNGVPANGLTGVGAPRRYNMEKIKMEKVPSNGDFSGFGSGVPDTIQSARIPSKPPSSQTNKQPLTARVPSGKKSLTPPFTMESEARPYRFNTPITPAQAIKSHSAQLTDFEQSEIFDYPKIYCIGNTKNKIRGSVSNTKCNNGYDDQRGDYQIVIGDHMAYRYEVISMLGKGSFGQVCKCLDVKTNRFVALKIIRNKERFHHQALVEVEILKHLRDHDPEKHHHIIEMYNSFYFRNHLCITFELLSINLYEFIKNNNFQGLSLALIRRFAVQILNSLKYLYREQIIHCDLKPENILLKSANKSAIKVIDFGSSCFVENRMYTYIQSRFYRSPEVILGIPYGRGIDMWSFGCILAELYMGYPIFPGENEVDQMNYIMEIFDVPPRRIIEMASRRKHFFDSYGNPRLVICRKSQRKRKPGSKDLGSVLKCKDKNFLTFLDGCLKWDPNERLTPEDALRHEWILESLVTNPVKDITARESLAQYAMNLLSTGVLENDKSQNSTNSSKEDENVTHLPPINDKYKGHNGNVGISASSAASSTSITSV